MNAIRGNFKVLKYPLFRKTILFQTTLKEVNNRETWIPLCVKSYYLSPDNRFYITCYRIKITLIANSFLRLSGLLKVSESDYACIFNQIVHIGQVKYCSMVH